MSRCVVCDKTFVAPSELKEFCPNCWVVHRKQSNRNNYEKRKARKKLNNFYSIFYSGYKKYVRSKKFEL